MAAVGRSDGFHWIKETSRDSKGIILEDHISEVASFLTVREAATWHASHPRLFEAHPISKIAKTLKGFSKLPTEPHASKDALRFLAKRTSLKSFFERIKEADGDEQVILMTTITDTADAIEDDLKYPSREEIMKYYVQHKKDFKSALLFISNPEDDFSWETSRIKKFIDSCYRNRKFESLDSLRKRVDNITSERIKTSLHNLINGELEGHSRRYEILLDTTRMRNRLLQVDERLTELNKSIHKSIQLQRIGCGETAIVVTFMFMILFGLSYLGYTAYKELSD